MAKHRQDGAGKIVPTTHDQPYRHQSMPWEGAPAPLRAGSPVPHSEVDRDNRLERTEWLKANIRSMIAVGQLDDADLAALPPAVRARAKELEAECKALHESGAHVEAQRLAEESAYQLAGMLPDDWSPPRADNAAAIADGILRRVRPF
jgi:hypothetical protein